MIWDFEPGHSAAEFACRHMMVTWVRGHFKGLEGKLEFEWEPVCRGTVSVTIDTASIWTGESERDAHLRSADFLDVENHPKMTFEGRSVEALTQFEFRVNGTLTIRGVTKPVVLNVRYLGQWETPYWENGVDRGPMIRAGFCAKTVINFTISASVGTPRSIVAELWSEMRCISSSTLRRSERSDGAATWRVPCQAHGVYICHKHIYIYIYI